MQAVVVTMTTKRFPAQKQMNANRVKKQNLPEFWMKSKTKVFGVFVFTQLNTMDTLEVATTDQYVTAQADVIMKLQGG